MSRIYLVRHGQAGTRDAYDALSDLGRQQARLLGRHFAQQHIEFAAACTGALRRQRSTAEEVAQACAQAGGRFPRIEVDEAWNEFDLNRVYSDLAPLLAAQDEVFAREYADLCEQVERNPGVRDAAVHRRWLPCDTRLVEAWIGGRFPYAGESWEEFVGRIAACRHRLAALAPRGNLVVFTSAVPVAIWAGMSLDICDTRIMRLAAVLYNTSFSILQWREEQLRLFAFNAAPHLHAPELRTHR
ncbi:MAG TPA: histidine phosphatase family protein [Terriglobales bacterium]|nr:histidine phosphatase family protein [Terriglobales bacterium]